MHPSTSRVEEHPALAMRIKMWDQFKARRADSQMSSLLPSHQMGAATLPFVIKSL